MRTNETAYPEDEPRPPADEELLTIREVARRLKVCPATARKMFRHEPGVGQFRAGGKGRAIMRVPTGVFNRFLRRGTIPYPAPRTN